MRVAPAVTISTEFLFRSWVASTSAPPIIAHLSTYHNCLDAYKIPEAPSIPRRYYFSGNAFEW